MKLTKKLVPRTTSDIIPPKLPKKKSKRRLLSASFGAARRAKVPGLATKPTALVPAAMGGAAFAPVQSAVPVPNGAGGPKPTVVKPIAIGVQAVKDRASGVPALPETAAARVPPHAEVATAEEPSLIPTETNVEPAAPSGGTLLDELLTEMKSAVQLLQLIAEATAASARSKRQRSQPSAQPADPALIEHLAGKKMLDIAAVEALVGAKRSTIYGWIQEKRFVQPVRLSAKSSRWLASEVEAWLDAKAHARSSAGTDANTGTCQHKEAA